MVRPKQLLDTMTLATTLTLSRIHLNVKQQLWLLPALLIVIQAGNSTASPAYEFNVPKPEFGESLSDLNVTTFAGHISRLPCTVRHLAGKQVSWIRGRDLTVLSSGRITFATDVRISVLPGTGGSKRMGRSVRIFEAPERMKLPSSGRDLTENVSNEATQWLDSKLYSESNRTGLRGWKPILLDNTPKRRVVRQNKIASSWDGPYFKQKPYRRSSSPQVHRDGYREPERHVHGDYIAGNTFIYNEAFEDQTRSSRRDMNENSVGRTSRYTRHYADEGRDQPPSWGFKKQISKIQVTGVSPQADYPRKSSTSVSGELDSSENVSRDTEDRARKTGVMMMMATTYATASALLPPNYLEGVWEPEDFTLQIKFTEPGDSGTYICQVNTEPRTAQKIHLTVVDMVAKILGPKELFVKAGTPVTLSCQVDHSAKLPGFIFWYKGDRLVDYEASAGRIQVITKKEGQSDLIFTSAQQQDSSNYTCGPAGGQSASVLLSVIVDERPAAMQQGNSAATGTPSLRLLFLALGTVAASSFAVSKILAGKLVQSWLMSPGKCSPKKNFSRHSSNNNNDNNSSENVLVWNEISSLTRNRLVSVNLREARLTETRDGLQSHFISDAFLCRLIGVAQEINRKSTKRKT